MIRLALLATALVSGNLAVAFETVADTADIAGRNVPLLMPSAP